MTTPKPENPFVSILQGAASSFFQSKMPAPQGNEVVPISPEAVLRQIQTSLADGAERADLARQALLLAAILGSQANWTLKDALTQAGIAWEQTRPLRSR